MAFEAAGARCVFTAEANKFARQTYEVNFCSDHPVVGDVRDVEASEIPPHDILVAGFPCQPFSLAGVSKQNSLGRAHGFLDTTRGTLFFEVARILAEKQPKMFLLENVKNILSHDCGRTFETIIRTLNEIGYDVTYRIVDASKYVPQNRKRVAIIGSLRRAVRLQNADSVWEAHDSRADAHRRLGEILDDQVPEKYVISDKLWTYLQNHAAKHRERGNGFGYGLVDANSISRTLSARYHKDGSEILVACKKNGNPRRLTPRECARLMGFPEAFQIPVSDTQAYMQFGNSVVVPLFTDIAKSMICELTK